MARLELGKLASYDLLHNDSGKKVFYVRLTDSLQKTLDQHHNSRSKGNIQLSINKLGRGGGIKIVRDEKTLQYSFKLTSIASNTGIDCVKQTATFPALSVLGTARSKMVVEANEDVYQSTQKKIILAEEKKNENQAVMIDLKGKRKTNPKKASTEAKNPLSGLAKVAQRSVPTIQKPTVNDSASRASTAKLRDRAIHLLALRPHRKIEVLSRLSDAGNTKAKDTITKILAQVSNTQNNMFHLKHSLYTEVQVESWPDYSDSDREAIRQQLRLIKGEDPKKEAMATEEPPVPPPQPITKPSEPQQETRRPTRTGLITKAERKRSSSDDTANNNLLNKKQCTRNNFSSLSYNWKILQAGSDLKLPFMTRVKEEIERLQSHYITISSMEQRDQYASDFEREYEEYLALKKKDKEISDQFDKLKERYDLAPDKRSSEVRQINRKVRDLFKQYIRDSNWCRDKERLMKLEAKLAHIKFLLKEFEKDNSGAMV